MAKSIEHLLESFEVLDQPLQFCTTFGATVPELLPHAIQRVPALGGSGFGKLKLLQVM